MGPVNGRNDISWEKKFELDVWYVDHVSLDSIQIFWLLVLKTLLGVGVSASGHATMPEFEGTKELQARN